MSKTWFARLVGLFTIIWPLLALGHAGLLQTTPAAGEVLAESPAQITLRFTEPVGVTVLRLFDPGGHATELKDVTEDGPLVTVGVPPQAAQGSYLLSWRVISADGHPVGGTVNYAVGAATPAQHLVLDRDATSRDVLIWLVRWLGYLCLFAVLGAALFRPLHPADRARWVRPLIVLGVLLVPVALALQGLDMLATPWSALAQATPWREALHDRYTLTLALFLLAFGLAAWALSARRRAAQRALSLGALLAGGVALAASGHASTAPPRWLARPTVALHTMMAMAWIGSLIPLARALPGGAPGAGAGATRTPLAAFSRWIVPVLIVLVAAGIGLMALQFRRPSDFVQTAYGRVLFAKLVLVALLLLVAAWNRWRITRAVRAGASNAGQRLRRTIAVEVVLGAAILAVVSLWRFTPPPRTVDATAAAEAPHRAPIALQNDRVHARLEPAAGGWVVHLSQAADGTPFAAQEVRLTFSNPTAQVEPISGTANAPQGGTWRVDMPPLPPIGHWQVQLSILIDDFDQIVLSDAAPASPSTHAATHGAMHHADPH